MKKNGLDSVWIGVYDQQTEGTWRDDNGVDISYTNWNSGEPNGKTGENCVQLLDNGKWVDRTCKTSMASITEPSTFEQKYEITSGSALTWSQAQAKAQADGRQLAIPLNDDDTNKLTAFMKKKGVATVWTGISDTETEGVWRDVHSNAVSYNNWKSGEPNGRTGENCVGALPNGQWNDLSCDKRSEFVTELPCKLTLFRNWKNNGQE